MSNPINGHIDFDERDKWDKADEDLRIHIANSDIHVPTPPAASGNYYLGNDLTWHKVPSAVIT